MSKKTWFILFNLGTILYLIVSATLRWDSLSIFSSALALAIMNWVAWISARKYKEWR